MLQPVNIATFTGYGKHNKIITIGLDTFKEKIVDANNKKILSAMKKAGKPVRAGDIADVTKIDKNEVTRIIKKLKDDGIISSPKRCFYETV